MNVKAKLDFGIYGNFIIGFDFAEDIMQQIRNMQFKGHDTADFIKEVVIEHVINLRQTVEQLKKQFNYNKLKYVQVDAMKISGSEVKQRMLIKEDDLKKAIEVERIDRMVEDD